MAQLSVEDVLTDLHAVEAELREMEAKYGIRSPDFYQLYTEGETDQSHDFQAWAGYYEVKLRRDAMYRQRAADAEAAGVRLDERCRELVAA